MKKILYLLLFSGLAFYACSDKSLTGASTNTPVAAQVTTASTTTAPAVTAPGIPRRAEVLFLGNASTHHNSGRYAPWLAIPLFAKGINVTYTIDTNDINAENLAKYDGLIIYANYDRISTTKEKALKYTPSVPAIAERPGN